MSWPDKTPSVATDCTESAPLLPETLPETAEFVSGLFAKSFQRVETRFDELFSGHLETLVFETRRAEKSQASLARMMERLIEVQPENLFLLKADNERLYNEIRTLQQQLALSRRATLELGVPGGGKFFVRFGREVQRDVNAVNEHLEKFRTRMRQNDPKVLGDALSLLKKVSDNLGMFASEFLAYGDEETSSGNP